MDDTFYTAVTNTMQDGLLVVNTEGMIMSVNPSFETMTGYSSKELVGQRCTLLNCTGCKRLPQKNGNPWCAMFTKRRVRNRKCVIQTKTGSMIDVLKSATVLCDENGQIIGAVETLRDITEMVCQAKQIQLLRSTLKFQEGNCGIIGSSKNVQQLLNLIRDVAQSEASVLIYGESGVGKGLVAQAIHELGPRAEGPFVKVLCASLNENLLESELFGHVKGAFTGAGSERIGRFEAASGGAIFLDEIGDVSPSMQVKLLRVLEAKEIERVGDHRTISVDARVIAATNRNLDHLVAQGIFRKDLFYRISVVPILVPPLRERKEDIPLLAQTFIDEIASRSNKTIMGLSQEALSIMLAYDWPGNIRELRNVIEYAFVLCRDSLIEPPHLMHKIKHASETSPLQSVVLKGDQRENPYLTKYHEKRDRLLEALRVAGGNRSKAARILGVSRVTVWKRMKKFGINTSIQ